MAWLRYTSADCDKSSGGRFRERRYSLKASVQGKGQLQQLHAVQVMSDQGWALAEDLQRGIVWCHQQKHAVNMFSVNNIYDNGILCGLLGAS